MVKGYIYKGKHEGWYSVSDETFYPSTQVQTTTDAKGKQVTVSIETGKIVEWTAEENYKFRLGMVKDKLIDWLEKDPHGRCRYWQSCTQKVAHVLSITFPFYSHRAQISIPKHP
jgi:methionyl-tRNA synthetase